MKRITLIQIGIGTVGGAVVEQVLAHRERWRQTLGLDLAVGAVVGREWALVGEDGAGLSDETLGAVLVARRNGDGLRSLAGTAGTAMATGEQAVERSTGAGATVVADAAAGERTAALGALALARGAGVVLSNKAPLALPWSDPAAAALWAAAGPGGRLRYEATCGAGLPVFSTLRALLDTGDEVTEIQGALSGTLGAIFSDVASGTAFSVAVAAAKDAGYTEPDPRDDLSGLDVARKALILARTLGRRVNLDEIAVESLVPAHLAGADTDAAGFLARIGELDAAMAERGAAARGAGQTLKYVATVPAAGPIAVGVRAIPTVGVLGALQGPENVIAIRTRRYSAYPLSIAGPGAGAAVTAAGMLADVLALAAGPLTGAGINSGGNAA